MKWHWLARWRLGLQLAALLASGLSGAISMHAQNRPHLTVGSTMAAVSSASALDLNGNEAGIDYNATFAPGVGAALIVDADTSDGDALTIASESNLLSGATIRLTNNLDGASETLAVSTTGTPITATLGAAGSERTLTLSGLATRADYQQALRTVTYNDTASPRNANQRLVELKVKNGNIESPIAVSRIFTLGGAQILNEPGDGYRVRFIGNPSQQYTVQYSPTILSPNWQTLELKVPDPSGIFFVIDVPPAGTTKRFCRAIIP